VFCSTPGHAADIPTMLDARHEPLAAQIRDDEAILALENVRVGFGAGRPALDGVSCVLRANEILGLVGETGGGKVAARPQPFVDLVPEAARSSSGDIRYRGPIDRRHAGYGETPAAWRRHSLIGTNAKALLDPVTPVGRRSPRPRSPNGAMSRAEAHASAIELLRKVGITNPAARAAADPHELFRRHGAACRHRHVDDRQSAVLLADDATLGLDGDSAGAGPRQSRSPFAGRGLAVMLIT